MPPASSPQSFQCIPEIEPQNYNSLMVIFFKFLFIKKLCYLEFYGLIIEVFCIAATKWCNAHGCRICKPFNTTNNHSPICGWIFASTRWFGSWFSGAGRLKMHSCKEQSNHQQGGSIYLMWSFSSVCMHITIFVTELIIFGKSAVFH